MLPGARSREPAPGSPLPGTPRTATGMLPGTPGPQKLPATAGRHLRVHRALRLGAVGYLIMLHCWVLVLLLHSLPTLPTAEPRPARAADARGLRAPGDRM